MKAVHRPPPELLLGLRINQSVPETEQVRQRAEVIEILNRLRTRPGVVLADEVGMGKTFVALAIAYCIAMQSPRGPVIVMAPGNLLDKWEQDLDTFCELYLDGRRPTRREDSSPGDAGGPGALRYGVARSSVELLKLLDDSPAERCQLILLAQGAMARRQSDKWVRLALIAEALRRHGRGGAALLIKVKRQIHRFLGELLMAVGEQKAHGWGEDLWQTLLQVHPTAWKETYNANVRNEAHRLRDDPVPKAVLRALNRIEHLRPLAEAVARMPIRASFDEQRTTERIREARCALRKVEEELWKELLTRTRWRSPLLVLDEAHHLKNPGTSLARQLQSSDSLEDLRTGDGAMAGTFDRMLFLTATPFQLGHRELVHVLKRFGDVRWDEAAFGPPTGFGERLRQLAERLDESQRTAIAFQRCWSRLRPDDGPATGDSDHADWWRRVMDSPRPALSNHQRAAVEAFEAARHAREAAEEQLRPWIVRHNKGACWAGSHVVRRLRRDGAGILSDGISSGLSIPPEQLLPFFLAARSAANPARDLLGDALCSSYEAFRWTRLHRAAGRDVLDDEGDANADLGHAKWYLGEFDAALQSSSGAIHPKISATVRRAVDLWQAGEKVLVFAFYRRTCRALRVHLSVEIERRCEILARQRLNESGENGGAVSVNKAIESIQRRYFDDPDAPGRKAMDEALNGIVHAHDDALAAAQLTHGHDGRLVEIMRRFLRVKTTLVRSFPLGQWRTLPAREAVSGTLDSVDASGLSWREKFDGFLKFLTHRCSSAQQREDYLEACLDTKTGGIRVEEEDEADHPGQSSSTVTVANVQVATGLTRRETRTRLMRAFNTPFFPDILVCSEVMGEGVDLQRSCRHVIHHDPAWNPSTIEQRTGRIDRLGCKAEGRHPILVYIPFLSGTADERQYRVMSERERWFRVVMGQDEVARLITADVEAGLPLPEEASQALSFQLDLARRG